MARQIDFAAHHLNRYLRGKGACAGGVRREHYNIVSQPEADRRITTKDDASRLYENLRGGRRMTNACRTRADAVRCALLEGAYLELLRFVVVADKGAIRFATLANPMHIKRQFMIDIAKAAERSFPKLEPYADRDRVLFTMPVTVGLADTGEPEWHISAVIPDATVEACGERVVQIALDVTMTIMPIMTVAIESGEFP